MTPEPELFAPPAPGDTHRTYTTPRQVVFGDGAADRTGPLASAFGTSALLVTYPPGRTTAAGGPARVEASLVAAGIWVTRREISADPEFEAVDEAVSACLAAGADVVVGVGGGGPLDAAKAVAMVATNPGTAEEYLMGRAVERAPLPFVAVPTTIGTGSEATMVSVLRHRGAGVVRAIRDPRMIPPLAILDPRLLAALPPRLLRLGACDGLAHAVESYLSRNATAFTAAHSHEGVRLIGAGMRALAAGHSADAIPDLLLGSYFAGVALQAGPGLAHVLAQPITAVTGIPHSHAIAALLPHTVEFNEAGCPGDRRFASLAALIEPRGDGSLAGAICRLLEAAGATVSLRGLGAEPGQAAAILEVVRRTSGHIGGNPVRLTMEIVAAVLDEALAAPPEG